jgi:hypothetical protein
MKRRRSAIAGSLAHELECAPSIAAQVAKSIRTFLMQLDDGHSRLFRERRDAVFGGVHAPERYTLYVER